MNGLCPACRRQYNDNDIEYKAITAEEAAAHKAQQAQKQKKTQQALQKEKQKAEADNLSRKHLAGLRVMQKNLVYVTGLTPNLQEDKLLQILRSDQYFGRYGEIIKIVVSKAKDTAHPQSVGVYVTYKRKEDAAQCIAAVDGSKNGDRTLRAQFGTTKYCSAYLRGENCPNRTCMFLHEPGEANESYSRAALSSFNAGQHGPERSAPPQSQMPVASASQPNAIAEKMGRQSSDDRTQSPSTDRPALPSTASWASKLPQHIPSRTESRSTSGVVESPVSVNATPAPSQSAQSPIQERAQLAQEPPPSDAAAQSAPKPERSRKPREPPSPLSLLLKNFNLDNLRLVFSIASLPASDAEVIANYPPLFDREGGAKRRLRRQREEEQRRMEQEAQELQQHAAVDSDENAEMSGSLQLGGEPEEPQIRSQPQSAIQPPGQDGFPGVDQRFLGPTSPGISDRGMTRQQVFLQDMRSLQNQGSYLNNPNQSSTFGQQPSHPPGHQRNASRFSFANESSASTSVKAVANPKLLSQQSSIMPPAGNTHFGAQHQQQHGSQFYTSNVQGPPPGLRTSGTPPVSGGMTFGQGHGFATGGIQYSAGAGRNSNEEMMRNLLVQRRDAPGATGADQAKREYSSYSTNNAFAGSQAGAFSAGGSLAASGAFPTGPPSNYSLSSFSGEEKRGKKKTKRHKHNNASSSSGGTNLNLGDVDPMGTAARFGSAGGTGYGQAGGLYTGGMHGGGGYRGGW